MKRFFLSFFLVVLSFSPVFSQQDAVVETEARGTGLKREDALQDALRNAVSQAVGVAMSSETRVENYMVISDAIASKTSGYIKTYQVLKESPFPDRYEISVKASVTTAAMQADFGMLAKAIGGVRFMVVYDPRTLQADQIPSYDFAVDKMNEYLSSKGYRYIERNRFEALRTEAIRMLESDKSEISFIQQLGLKSDAQFIISLNNLAIDSRSEQFDTRTSSVIRMQAKAFDNCTAEGLGTVSLESSRISSADASSSVREGIAEAILKNADQLTNRFITYIGDWINNGTPYELRFYNVGTYRDFRDLRNKMKESSKFGGDMEIVSVENYSKLNCTFKKKPDELADHVLDLADQIPGLMEKKLDVKLIYGRQINFAPGNVLVPELQNLQREISNQNNGRDQAPTRPEKEQSRVQAAASSLSGTPKTGTGTSSKKTKTPVAGAKTKVKSGLKPIK